MSWRTSAIAAGESAADEGGAVQAHEPPSQQGSEWFGCKWSGVDARCSWQWGAAPFVEGVGCVWQWPPDGERRAQAIGPPPRFEITANRTNDHLARRESIVTRTMRAGRANLNGRAPTSGFT